MLDQNVVDDTIDQLTRQNHTPKLSADWVIEQIRLETWVSQVPMNMGELHMLGTDMIELTERPDFNQGQFVSVNNRGVQLIRDSITATKDRGEPVVSVRPRLTLPYLWEVHYEIIYTTNYPALISGVLQNAFFGNPTWGEKRPWTSR